MIIAIDGPAGAGKSTVSRMLAKRLGFLYLDTGAMYRAVAWALARHGASESDDRRWDTLLADLPLTFQVDQAVLKIFHEGRELDAQLRVPEITEAASRISRVPAVRRKLTALQRQLAEGRDLVAEGRDMGTVVFGYAELKIFLTADLASRAERRLRQWREQGIAGNLEQIMEQIAARDRADQERLDAPLRPADDARLLDTSRLSIEQVVDRLLELVDDRRKAAASAESKTKK